MPRTALGILVIVTLATVSDVRPAPAGRRPDPAKLADILEGGAEGAAPQTAAPEPPPPPAAGAARLPASTRLPTDWTPRPWDGGSISMGTTDEGYLVHAASLPARGDGWRLLAVVPERGTFYGTDELVAAIRRAAHSVAAKHPGPRLVVGNLSLAYGGPIGFSQSHTSGRDADLLFYAKDARSGAPVEPTDFVLYRCDGTSEDGRLTFDVARNWALVESLLTDPTIEVQFLFVSGCQKRQLLAYARATGAPAAVVARAEGVLWRPTDSEAHRDHFHLRIYCPPGDTAAGCRDAGRWWDWATNRPEARAAASERIERDLRSRDPARRRAAVRALVDGWHPHLAYRLCRLADDSDRGVRAAAVEALAVLDPEECYGPVASLLKPPTDLARFRRGLAALVRLSSAGSAWRLEQLLEGTYAPLEELRPDRATRAELRTLSARGLGRFGRYRSIPALLTALDDPQPSVREAARGALRHLTTQRAEGDQRDAAAVAKAWRAWWARDAGEKEADWHHAGFRAAGFDVPFQTWTWGAVPALVAAAGGRDEVGWTAHRLLVRIAKRGAPPWHPDPDIRAARWKAWWWGAHARLARQSAAPAS